MIYFLFECKYNEGENKKKGTAHKNKEVFTNEVWTYL